MDTFFEYKCETCQKTFDENTKYSGHMINCGKLDYECSICDCKFRNQKELDLHISNHRCEICNSIFTQPGAIGLHMKNIHGKNTYPCDMCEKVFTAYATRYTHIRRDHLIMKYECEICNQEFTGSGNLKSHIVNIHENSKKHECNICHKTFNQDTNLKWHKNKWHKDGQNFQCDQCKANFLTLIDLENHKLNFHEEKWPCKVCDKIFDKRILLWNHDKRVHKGIKRHQCSECAKKFYAIGDLKKHSNVHISDSTYNCQFCKIKFKLEKSLVIHIHKVHINSKKTKHCQLCNKAFTNRLKIEAHIKHNQRLSQKEELLILFQSV